MTTSDDDSSAPVGPTSSLDADRPVRSAADDLFRRAEFAATLATHVGSVPDGQSLVFSLVGAWGAGKTSVLHMMEERLREKSVEVVWFNPWLFSGPEQIATQFMRELGLQLGSKERDLGRVGELVESYGKVLEVGGAMFSGALKALGPIGAAVAGAVEAGAVSTLGGAVKTSERESIRETRERVEKALRDAGRRIVVFVDDIDRLDGQEIRLVFKMVRLVADFPNVSYVLAFDRSRVERALDNEDMNGRAYLAKIVQASFDLPPLEPEILGALLPKELNRCISGRRHGPFHEHDWQDIFFSVIRPLVKHPRDVRRYLNAVAPAVDMLGEEVALEDVLALEAVRVFLPDVYDKLPENADLLAMGQPGRTPDRHQRDEATTRVKEFLKLGGDSHEKVVTALCKFLFPMSRFAIDNHVYSGTSLQRWRRERRVACADVLNVYLERVVRVGDARVSLLRTLVGHFGDEEAVDQALGRLSSEELESTLGRLEDYTAELAKTDFENGLVAVLRNADRLRLGRGQPFDFGANVVVSRLVLWTLKSVKDEGRRIEAVKALMSRTPSFTWRADVLRVLQKHKDNESLLDEALVRELFATLKSEILAATPDHLAAEREPEIIVRVAHDEATKTFHPRLRAFLEHSGFFRALLASLLSESMSWGLGSVAVKVTTSLPWDSLKVVAGGESELRTLLQAAVDAGPAPDGNERMAKALQIAQDVLAGRKEMIDLRDRHDVDDEEN